MKMGLKFISILSGCTLIIISNISGQNDKRFIDSVNITLLKYKSDSERINRLTGICYDLIWHRSGKGDIIDTLANEDLLMAKNIKFKKGIADAYNILGNYEWYYDNYTASIDDYTNAEKIEEEINYTGGFAETFEGIAEINSENQNYTEAILNFNKALRAFSELKDTDGFEEVLEDMSECYIYKNSYDSAFILAEQSLNLSEKRHDQFMVINALDDIGKYYAAKNDNKNSMKVFSQMLSIIDTLKDKDNQLIDYYRGIASAFFNLKQYDEAITNANKSLEIANKIGSIDDVMKSENLISIIYEQMGNGSLALKHYKIYDSIHNQIFSQNNTRRELRSEVNFQLEKQQAEQEKVEAIERQRFYIIVIILTSIVLGLILVILFVLKIRKQNKTIQEKDILLLIAGGENDTVEFKASLKYDVDGRAIELGKLKTDAERKEIEKIVLKGIEFGCIKTIAAFLNSEGGTLLIGVKDGRNIIGLEQTDFLAFSKSSKKDHFDPSDHWKLLLDSLIKDKIGNATHALIKTQLISIEDNDGNNGTIAVIKIKRYSEPIWMKNEKEVQELYIRQIASTEALQGQEAMKYINLHWKK